MKLNPSGLMWVSGLGAGITALCCFTPVAVIALGAAGAGAAVAWLDSVLLPALILFAALFAAAWVWGRRRGRACAVTSSAGIGETRR